MPRTVASFVLLTVILGQALSAQASDDAGPMIDYTHDQVQTTLKADLNRIGTLDDGRGAVGEGEVRQT